MANAALGGDTCHRGSLLGGIFGCAGALGVAAAGGCAPIGELSESVTLQGEITTFLELVVDRRQKHAEEQQQQQQGKTVETNKDVALPSSFVLRFPPTAKSKGGPEVEACAS